MNKILLIEGDINNAFFSFRKNLVDEINKKYNLIIVGSSTRVLDVSTLKNKNINFFYLGTLKKNPFSVLVYLYKVLIIVIKEKPNICISFNLRPNLAISFAKYFVNIKTIATITGTSTFFKRPSPIRTFILKHIFLKFDYLFFQNISDMNLFESNNIIAKNHVLVPGSGVDTSYFHKLKSSNSTSSVNFILISRLLKDKGVIEYINAAEKIKKIGYNAKFSILGPFYQYGSSSNEIKKSDLKYFIDNNIIEYLGTTNNVIPYIVSSDCVVLPSYSEGMSNVLLEAASLSTPIITTDIPGCKEIVQDNFNGFLCIKMDFNDLTNKIIKFINLSKEERVQMGNNGRNKILKEFDRSIVVEKYMIAINNLIY
jgi:glycosyltransferase involved in cell wall biosynthesis